MDKLFKNLTFMVYLGNLWVKKKENMNELNFVCVLLLIVYFVLEMLK